LAIEFLGVVGLKNRGIISSCFFSLLFSF